MHSLLLPALLMFLGVFILSLLLMKRSNTEYEARETAKSRLKTAMSEKDPQGELSIVRKDIREDWLQRLVVALSPAGHIERSLTQAKVKIPITVFVLTILLFAVGGFLLGQNFSTHKIAAPACGFAGMQLPILWLRRRRNKRMGKFERQLPDALDLVARALKAGHGFNSGLRMVADEYDDPIGPEFQKTLEEINIGVPQDVALHNLTQRVDCPDLMFFVVSVNIQRETGGYLSEIMSNMASLVRERFKLHGRIRILSAEGRLSAWILLGLPVVAALAMQAINPKYMEVLYTTQRGNSMLMVSGTMMFLGVIVIKRLVRIRV